ncbi:MAG TPA: aminomethyl-transferring glycine dehydrogenase [Bacteroidia bacterium]|jgi:glycine dehydrogenase|nr:aminomethyl-transferring glycine dehydrogenase [Bacteroidia bacterium]
MKTDSFAHRHLGPRTSDIHEMLNKIGYSTLDELINATVPASIRLTKPLKLPESMTEHEYLAHVSELADKNKVFRSYIGLGYYNCIVPSAIRRNVLENPGWYTAYTPYQAEISQGRLEALLNFQTTVVDLTGMPIANASLLDEATAAAEAMLMFYHSKPKDKEAAHTFFVSNDCFPQTIDVLKTRSAPLGITITIGDVTTANWDGVFGVLLQYPAANGKVTDYSALTKSLHDRGIYVAVASDLLALALLTPPGEWGADVVVGNSQRFGVPMGYGGPHAAFFATQESFKRVLPGRIIGVSVDAEGNRVLRMALQTREQHIRREKATSNICTAQALLAVMASMYAVYHGPQGIKNIAKKVHQYASYLAHTLNRLGYSISNHDFFDTIEVNLPAGMEAETVRNLALKNGINFNYTSNQKLTISLDETTSQNDLSDIIAIFTQAAGKDKIEVTHADIQATENFLRQDSLLRKSTYLQHSVFNMFHSETELMRYIKRLENKDLSLTHSMISLGSCTMKLNAASELYPITMPGFANMHPFAPLDQAKGYTKMCDTLAKYLCEITGFKGVSLQPNSGAQGEYAGLLVIRAYHISRGEGHRNIALIPASAHGTNPASAAMVGMQIVVVKCTENGNIDMVDLKEKATLHKDNLSCFMVTYPSTYGVFEETISEITKIIHKNGGQVYMDGANMNAQVGLTNPARIGADVCHLNLHKTFAIPHGGGGPGMGPIGVAKHLVPFLPGHNILQNDPQAIHAVSAAPWGSALILLISYGYIRMLGQTGCTDATKYAILNANYIKACLKDSFKILYTGTNGNVAHELILDCSEFKRSAGIEVTDIAKRLMDYGFHAPTVSFPVHDSLMVEPTESEAKEELDRFVEAMLSIRNEIAEVLDGRADATDNVLKNSPHPAKSLIADTWNHKYSREKAAYPLHWLRENKFWVPVARADNAYGDRNLMCTCPPIEEYAHAD